MLIHIAFDETLKTYRISGKRLAHTANLSESLVSEFRRGKGGVTDQTLNKLLIAMETIDSGARRYFCSLIAGKSKREGDLSDVIEGLSEDEIPQLLIAIANRWQSPQKKILSTS